MTTLSPTAQAVIDAAERTAIPKDLPFGMLRLELAAGIGALVAQTLPEEHPPLMMRGHELERLVERQRIRAKQLAVAAELEGSR